MARLYVGNVPFTSTDEDLRNFFGTVGTVTGVSIVTDRETGRARGFAFIDMENAEEAIQKFNGVDFGGRKLVVNVARERAPRSNDGGHSQGGGGYSQGDRYNSRERGGERGDSYNRGDSRRY